VREVENLRAKVVELETAKVEAEIRLSTLAEEVEAIKASLKTPDQPTAKTSWWGSIFR
jgi:hypothetical protein